MNTLVDLQLSVGLFVGMAATMLVPRVRRWVPFWIEACIWLGLIVACWLAVTNIQQANVRYLTESVAWGLGQVLNTSIGFIFAGVLAWLTEHRFGIANATVVLLGVDALLLSLLRSHRKAEERQPRILLGEWIEIPLYRTPALAPVAVPYAMDEWNRRAERAAAVLAAAFLTWLVQMLIWTRDVVVPQARARQAQAIAAGRVHAAYGLEALRERAIQVQVAAREWRVQHAPAIAGLTARAGHVVVRVAVGGSGVVEFSRLKALTDNQVVNIRALLRAQTIGWYGPIEAAPAGMASDREEEGEDESERLAS